jgi:hypothetical protein
LGGGNFIAARREFLSVRGEIFAARQGIIRRMAGFDFGNSSTENRQTDMYIRRLKVKPG